MNKYLFLVIICLILVDQKCQAQVDLKEKYETKTVYLQKRFLRNREDLTPIRKFESEFARFNDSKWEFNQYKRKRKTGFVSLIGFVGLWTAGIITFEDNSALGTSLYASGLGVYIFSLSKVIQSQNHLHKSVWYYNRDVLLEEE